MKYTIVAFNEAEGQSITDTVGANDPNEAMRAFAADRAFPEGTVIVDIFAGELTSVMPAEKMCNTVYCSDLEE